MMNVTEDVKDILSSSGAYSYRNKIINGDMRIAQRYFQYTGVTNSVPLFPVDRFTKDSSGTGVVLTSTREADAPDGTGLSYSIRWTVTTPDTSAGATDYLGLTQNIEGTNVRDLLGKAFTLSFWVRSSVTGVYCVSFANSTGDRSFIVEYTIDAANTWEKKVITVTNGLISEGTWDWGTGKGLGVRWAILAGSNWHTTAGTWQTGNFTSTANQANAVSTAGNIFALTGVQLEAGSAATPFEHRPYGVELALCQRYFEKSYNIDTPVGSVVIFGTFHSCTETGWILKNPTLRFAVAKRATPTLTFYYPLNGTPGGGNQYNSGGTAEAYRPMSAQVGQSSAELGSGDGAFTVAAGTQIRCHWTADAEL